jgi:hypothetical protein
MLSTFILAHASVAGAQEPAGGGGGPPHSVPERGAPAASAEPVGVPAPPPPASTAGSTPPSTAVDTAVGIPPEVDLRDGRYTDAHVDRAIIMPTAETHPRGTFYASSYEIVVVQAGYAVSDSTQITLTGMPPLPAERILPFDLTVKTVLVRAPEFRVAALGSVSGIAGVDPGTVAIGRVGGVTQLCFESACRSSVSVGTTLALAGPVLAALNGAAIVLRAASHVSILFEVDASIPLGSGVGDYAGIFAAPGLRFSGERFGFDFALAHSLQDLKGITVPFLAFTYRTQPD